MIWFMAGVAVGFLANWAVIFVRSRRYDRNRFSKR